VWHRRRPRAALRATTEPARCGFPGGGAAARPYACRPRSDRQFRRRIDKTREDKDIRSSSRQSASATYATRGRGCRWPQRAGWEGVGLSEMTRLGLPVRSGFTVTTDACRAHMESGGFPEGLAEELDAAVHRLEAKTGKTFGSTARPGSTTSPARRSASLLPGLPRRTRRSTSRHPLRRRGRLVTRAGRCRCSHSASR
jgi:hypothetical protein